MDARSVPIPAGKSAWPPAKDWSEAWWAAWLRGKGWDDPKVIEYLNQRRALSLVVTKGKGKSAERTVVYAPTPMGARFHLATAPNLLYGGAAGGAKSFTARHDAYLRLFQIPGARLLLLRRKFTELVDNHLNDAQREIAIMGKDGLGMPIRYLKDERRVVVERKGEPDSWLRFGHCEHEGDEDQYLSSEYEAVYPDEAATFTKKQVMGVASRLRTALPGVMPVLRCTSNPGGAQTLWLKQWFIDRAVGPDEDGAYNPAEWAFIPSMLYDNPYLMDPDGTWDRYAKRLSSLGPERARQMLDGDWDTIAGQFFGEFSRQKHVHDLRPIPADVVRFRCLDWGYNSKGACYWIACLPDGRLYVEHEYVFRQTLARDVAAEILRRNDILGRVPVRYTVADPSMWNHSGQVGESIAETFGKAGVPLIRGSNEREIGWQRMRDWLRPAPDGQPWMVISPDCEYLVRTLPALVSDEHKDDDVDTTGDDHGADACFVADTMIETATGPRRITDMRVGDQVWTRQGLAAVSAVFSVGVRDTLTMMLADGTALRGTPDHPIWVKDRGFEPLNHIRSGDMVGTWRTLPIPTTTAAALGDSGVPRTGRFLHGITSTIATTIPRITRWRTWSVFPRLFTCLRTVGCFPARRGHVRSAPESTAHSSAQAALIGFAQTPASLDHDVPLGWMTLSASVPVGPVSGRTGTMTSPTARGAVRHPVVIHDHIWTPRVDTATSPLPRAHARRNGVQCGVVSVRPSSPAQVYNLTVDGAEEYYANGVLVHNCRYGLMSRPSPTTASVVKPTPKKGTVGEMVAAAMREASRRMVLGSRNARA